MFLTTGIDGLLVLAEEGKPVPVCWVCGMPDSATVRQQHLPTCTCYVRPARGRKPELPRDYLPIIPGYYVQRSAVTDLRRGVLPGQWVTVRRDDTFLSGRTWCTAVRRAGGSARLVRVEMNGQATVVYPPNGAAEGPEVIREAWAEAVSC